MIQIRNLFKSFDGNQVLRGLNLDIQTGEALVIIGRSGCGKSVLLKLLMGIMEPDNGQVLIDGTDIFSLPSRELDQFRLKLGMLFQGAALFDSLTVAENVGFSLMEHTVLPREVILEKVRQKLGLVGLSGIEDLMPSALSGGMKKRVGLARAICNDPKIILYDEPTTGLDPIMADGINDLIVEMKQRLRVTTVTVTHDLNSAYKIADRIAMLYQGKIIGIGTPKEIENTDHPVVRQFITGSAKGPITSD
jgi:phospholipid/cholesterol/gamma-HCH transport system ATP-binding protein